MKNNSVERFIFSSTAAVYGEPRSCPIREEDPTKPTNPYGQSKLMIERILGDAARAGNLKYIALRYFNAAGADTGLRTGERHSPESHLIPNVLKAASGQKKDLAIFGDDYDTEDGTCVRDYIHVEDLAQAHLSALVAFDRNIRNEVFNLGNGNGYSVMQIVKEAERVTGKKIVYRMDARRPGDPAALVACSEKARAVLNWVPCKNLHEILDSAWRWELLENKKARTAYAETAA
jgi:UDP-glucose 4-epimerase